MTPDLTHLTRITTGPWQIGDVYRAYDTDGVRSGEWRRIETLCSTSIDAYSRMWPTAEVYRYVPPVVPPVWIRSTDRLPTAADLPIIVRRKSGGDTIWSDYVRGGIDYLWVPFRVPTDPAPSQADLDYAFISEVANGFKGGTCTPHYAADMQRAIDYGRTHPSKA